MVLDLPWFTIVLWKPWLMMCTPAKAIEGPVLISIQVHTLTLHYATNYWYRLYSMGDDLLVYIIWSSGPWIYRFIYKPTQLQKKTTFCSINRLHRIRHRNVPDGLIPLDCSETSTKCSLTKTLGFAKVCLNSTAEAIHSCLMFSCDTLRLCLPRPSKYPTKMYE